MRTKRRKCAKGVNNLCIFSNFADSGPLCDAWVEVVKASRPTTQPASCVCAKRSDTTGANSAVLSFSDGIAFKRPVLPSPVFVISHFPSLAPSTIMC